MNPALPFALPAESGLHHRHDSRRGVASDEGSPHGRERPARHRSMGVHVRDGSKLVQART